MTDACFAKPARPIAMASDFGVHLLQWFGIMSAQPVSCS